MTSPETLQDGKQSPAPQDAESGSPTGPVSRIKSTSSLLSHNTQHPEGQRPRLSFDSTSDHPPMTTSPILTDRDNGLRRIRQAPRSRKSSGSQQLPGTRSSSFNQTSPAESRIPSITIPSGPPSPVLAFTEDLSRFPQESLHSFSFAHQSEENLHNRQKVLKRSVDFMRDRLNWATSHPGVLSAQAKVSGDQEMQSMMELLRRAKVFGPDALETAGLGSSRGPLTGPADYSGENLFDKSFQPLVESPHGEDGSTQEVYPDTLVASPTLLSPTVSEFPTAAASFQDLDRVKSADSTAEDPSPFLGRRSQLKRTFTDIDPYALRNRLTDALAQPYRLSDSNHDTHIISPHAAPTVAAPHPRRNMTISPSGAPHTHGTRQHNAAQAIFTTEDHSPWTITAANDLACLVFGVTKAEVRKMGIMEVIREERRKWLENKLRPSSLGMLSSSQNSQVASPIESPAPSPTLGNGVTAKLLSKPPSRQTYQSRRSRANGSRASSADTKTSTANHAKKHSRGVLLCGDVVPIQKRNGALGSASLWVKEKQGGLIWVLEEIAEDFATLSVDEVGCITNGSGSTEAIFGLERIRRGMDIKKLIPRLPKQTGTHTGALDHDEIARTRRYTARTANSINIPITIDLLPNEPTYRVSSFPHIAGIMVLSSDTLKVTSSNSVFSSALFGYEDPNGMHVTELIPLFDKLLHLIADEDDIELKDGIVIPEHSFRRARALLAVRDGQSDAASIFLRPSGLPAKHRDGSEIMIDVQMRVLHSDRQTLPPEEAIALEQSASEVAFALWITYSRQMHAANHGVGPVAPTMMISRPGTPPHQPSPGQASLGPMDGDSGDDSGKEGPPAASVIAEKLNEASSQPMVTPGDKELYEHPAPEAIAAGVGITEKKSIADFAILEEMGKGAYGEVKLVRYKRANAQKMVVKYVTKRRILVDTWTRDRRLGTVPLEIHVLDYLRRDGLQHPNIIEMADFFEDDINYYIEMVPHGLPGVDLFDYIELRVNMEERECRQIFVQVANALHHLHVTAKVVHRDIKDENVILDGEGAVKLVDFGSAAYIKSGPFDVFVGTIDYAAPEVLRGLPYRGKEQDVWALGILLYTIVYKENPFYSIDEIMDHDLRVPYVMSEDCIDLIRRMLDRDVERRIGIQDVLEHAWCTHVDEDDEEDDESVGDEKSREEKRVRREREKEVARKRKEATLLEKVAE